MCFERFFLFTQICRITVFVGLYLEIIVTSTNIYIWRQYKSRAFNIYLFNFLHKCSSKHETVSTTIIYDPNALPNAEKRYSTFLLVS